MKKKILLVNCYRESAAEKIRGYYEWLKAAAGVAGVELEIQEIGDQGPFPAGKDFAAAVVSGSQKMVGDGEVEPGLARWLGQCRRPLLGVCYGHQALAHAFGCPVRRDEVKHLGDEEVRVAAAAGPFSGFPQAFPMRESHEEIVVNGPELARSFVILAESGPGQVEAIRHREYPLFGVQFHPEKSGELGVRLLVNFLNISLGSK
jgi:GMP synthase-like glutamine amidotransferase